MSAVFIWASHAQGDHPFALDSFRHDLEAWVPFNPEKSTYFKHPSGMASALIWETHLEGARGSFSTQTPTRSLMLSYSGWWREPDEAPLTHPSSGIMLAALCGERRHARQRHGYERGLADFSPTGGWQGQAVLNHFNLEAFNILHLSPGQFSVALADQDGCIHGLKSALGGGFLYYAHVQHHTSKYHTSKHHTSTHPITVISNRASLVSAFLNQGKPAPPRPESLAWLLARHEQPLGNDQEPWSEVKSLGSGFRISAHAGQMRIHPIPLPGAQAYEWDALFEGLCWRTEYLKRLPHVPYALALTGGYDSRLILGALIKTNQLKRVDRYYINATAQHSDSLVAQTLADHYQLPFMIEPPGRWQNHEESILSRLRRHNFFVEYLFNAWDLLSGPKNLSLPSQGLLPGHLGELYRAHYHWLMSRMRLGLTRGYASTWYADRHHLLTLEMKQYCAHQSRQWILHQYQQGVQNHFIFDELHRHARQEGWATRSIQVENMGFPSLCLLPCVSTRAHYESLPLHARRRPEIHFELTRRIDEHLWTFPFAEKAWPKILTQPFGKEISPIYGYGDTSGYQIRAWQTQEKELTAWLLDQDQHSLFAKVVDLKKLRLKISKVAQHTTAREVKGLLAACAIKIALEEPLRPFQLHRS